MSDQWQKIESAPRDGRIIIGWSPQWESPTAIQWVEEFTYQSSSGPITHPGDWDWNGTILCPPSHDPTHWQPMPNPPSTEELAVSENKTGIFYFSLPAEPGAQMLDIEDLYQAFKARLMAELVARESITHDAAVDYPLVEK